MGRFLFVMLIATWLVGVSMGGTGMVHFRVMEEGSAQLLPCRIHIFNAGLESVEPTGYPFFRDHITCNGEAVLKLAAGEYTYIVGHGPEYTQETGKFVLDEDTVELSLKLKPLTDLRAEGYRCGDLHIHRSLEDIELLIDAEGLDVAPVISWWNDRNLWEGIPLPEQPLRETRSGRYVFDRVGEDERNGGALMYFHLNAPLPIKGAGKDFPPMSEFALQGRELGAWLDIEKPFWWDVPIFVAMGLGDSIGLANNHMCRATMHESEAWGYPRDNKRLPAPRGNGFWTQEIYYHLLNTGHRIPPSAGSASGVLPNPVGYNRVYVHVGDSFTWEKWWAGLKAGRSFVTNGPLLRVEVNGELPGHEFGTNERERLSLELTAKLDGRDEVSAFEIIRNGEILRRVPVADWTQTDTLGTIGFEQSGWFLVRVIADEPDTFRFASTAPYYVRAGDVPFISEASVRFFLDWLEKWPDRLKEDDSGKRSVAMGYQERAIAYWEALLDRATAD